MGKIGNFNIAKIQRIGARAVEAKRVYDKAVNDRISRDANMIENARLEELELQRDDENWERYAQEMDEKPAGMFCGKTREQWDNECAINCESCPEGPGSFI